MALKRLWTGWRMEYIKSLKKKPSECIFCEALASGSDRDSLVLHRGRTCVLMLNLYPYNPGHLMAAPNRHVSSLGELTPEEGAELMELAALGEKILSATHNPQGFNLGVNLGKCAGAGVPDHLHLHLVPRWTGDTNFMPVMSETRVLPEEISTTYDRLYEAIKEAKA
jgi:ATP adenylyltransferase